MAGSKDDAAQTKRTLRLFNTAWHRRALTKLENLIEDERFLRDVETVRSWGAEKLSFGVAGLIKRYNAPISCYELFGEYVRTGQINHFYMRMPVTVVSTKEGTAGPSLVINNEKEMKAWLDARHAESPSERVYLELDPECTKQDLLDFIENWWSIYIEERLEKIKQTPVKRVRRRGFMRRNEDIYNHIKVQGKPAREVADKYNITPEYARKLALRFERDK